MREGDNTGISRRGFLGASAFMIVPRHVLGGPGYTPPSDKIALASIGMGRQGTVVTMDLLRRPDVQVVAVCDCNRVSKDYAEYGRHALLQASRRLLGPGHEKWGEDLASPGEVQLTHSFRTSLGACGREPAKRLVEACYGARTTSGAYSGCTAYSDFRELLEREKSLDAVYIATPDHWHAPIAIAAMRKRKHVLGQKPMCHSIGEARKMAEVARQAKVATSLTVANPSSENTRLLAGWIADGAIGAVREIHNWSSRPYWPQGIERPGDQPPVPEGLEWDLWLGPAPYRPYNKAYLPFVWRGWYDFGCGALGDMGCYSFAGIFQVMKLGPPAAVEASSSEVFEETYPKSAMIHFHFPGRANMPPVRLTWYDGGLKPPRPEGLGESRPFTPRGEGVMYVGEKGVILAGFNGDQPRVIPESKTYQAPPPAPRGADAPSPVLDQWVAACKGGSAPAANFEAQAPVTETVLLGNLALRAGGEKLNWDSAGSRITNVAAANQLVNPPYRAGWTLD